ncbi:MAG TPA: chemotactic signal-response protein chel [Rhodospirillaceae bacterium]|nr:chemotactic signal-response protein chel [Rhodospirillaceae bacterium]
MAAFDSSAIAGQASLALSQGKTAPTLGKGLNMAAARKKAKDFESVFVSQMFSQMFQGINADGMFGGGHGEEMFRSLLIDEYGKQVAQHGGIGIADAVMRTLISAQEKSA